jgi:signal transduction histidine kinase
MAGSKFFRPGLRRDLMTTLFFSGLVPVAIAGGLLYSQVRLSEKQLRLEREKIQQQVKNSVSAILRASVISCDGVATSSELLDFLSAPANLRRFSENRLFGRVREWEQHAPVPISWRIVDRKGAAIFSKGNGSDESPAFVEKGISLDKSQKVILIQRNLHFDDQGLPNAAAAADGALLCRVALSDIRHLESRLASIDKIPAGEDLDGLEVRVSETFRAERHDFWGFIGTVVGFLLIATAAGFFLLRRRVLLPIEQLTRRISEKSALTTEGRAGNEIDLLEGTVTGYLEQMEKRQEELVRQRGVEAFAQIAAQVAHDIRSPLAALDVVVECVDQLEEDQRVIIRGAVGRIRDIANNLLEKNRERERSGESSPSSSSGEASQELLSSLVDSLISEKRLQFRARIGVNIESILNAQGYGLFAKVEPAEFKRVLSNLINNSVEAIEGNGTVTVSVKATASDCRVEVSDTGKGMAPEVLRKIGELGETFGKSGGSGLGLYHARCSAEKWGGKLEISSVQGKGTQVVLLLPKAEAPAWFLSGLRIPPARPVVVLDDDASIHQIWRGRLHDSLEFRKNGGVLLHFSTPPEIRAWGKSHPSQLESALFLLDYELLGQAQTGLDVIRELQIGPRSILVTSRFDEPEIKAACTQLHVKLLPKGLAGFVPIEFG